MERNRLSPKVTEAIFNIGAFGYDHLTDQIFWKKHIKDLLNKAPKKAEKILDLGCGPGNSSFALAEKFGQNVRVSGVDISKKMLQRAEKNLKKFPPEFRKRIRFLQADASKLPFPDNYFDFAFGHSFLYLVSDRKSVLSEVFRTLKPMGTLMLMEPSRRVCPVQLLKSSIGALSPSNYDHHPIKYPLSTVKFALSVVTWRMMAISAGSFEPKELQKLAKKIGFAHVKWERTLATLGTVYIIKKSE